MKTIKRAIKDRSSQLKCKLLRLKQISQSATKQCLTFASLKKVNCSDILRAYIFVN